MQNPLALAYLGDSIYEVYIRNYLLAKGIVKVKDLQKEAVNYVSAENQARFVRQLLDQKFFYENEENVIMLGRNHKVHHCPKNASIISYKYATGLEALIGYLYLQKQHHRINEIMEKIIGGN